MNKNGYQIFDDFVLRTPLFPINTYSKLTNTSTINGDELKSFISANEFLEAIYFASPNLLELIIKYSAGLISDPKKNEKLTHTILKYVSRSCSRCTPFGLFASCGIGKFSNETDILLKDHQTFKRSTKLDASYIDKICQALLSDHQIKQLLKFYPNSSLYEFDEKYRYIFYTLENRKRSYHLDGAYKTDYLEALIDRAEHGKTITELVELLTSDGFSQEESVKYIDSLIENQLLVSDLEINTTGKESLDEIIDILDGILSTENTSFTKVKKIKEQLQRIDKSFVNGIEPYKFLKKKEIVFKTAHNNGVLLQTDSFSLTSSNTLSFKIKKQIKGVMSLLNRMSLPFETERLAVFKKRFKDRYENREVPLYLALDSELGIGYGSKKNNFSVIVDDIPLVDSQKRYQNFVWTDVDAILLQKTLKAIDTNTKIFELTLDDFKDFDENWSDLPDTMSSIIEVITIAGETKIVLDYLGGASGANLIARFGHLDHKIHNHIENIFDIENKMNPDKLIAEIVHLPQSKAGNITYRPVKREYEIPYLGKSTVSKEKQIDIKDIMISIKKGQIILRSKRLHREIIPKLTNAHLPNDRSLPIYRFLCDIQTEGKRGGIGFAWHNLFDNFSFLPRVIHKNVILSKAQWRIDYAEIEAFYNLNKEELLDTFVNWCDEKNIPEYVQVVERDNTLLINTKNINCVEMLLDTVKNKSTFILEEFLFTEDKTVTRNETSFCNEFVISLFNNQKLKYHGSDN
ncbi:lantibiotic dehydratase family protein [Tenacibaculum sp. MAR_2009_124]|uniref:lantibiotic dehydratase family protein n=1 Tax=Tenacibaculum sp. MAR_2009_124 TaxID=1250059 RepID=UPI000A8D6FF4|nr:lantibiotic dehydratase family protein [Tenacibaculum sp. MAR_2009_124]